MDPKQYRVSQGGLFHSHKIQYSKQTQDLIHRLLEESKLSILQRQTLKESFKKGEPLPCPTPSARSQSATGLRRGEVLVPPALPRRRSYQAIVKSGAYERDYFDPPYNSRMKDREAEKQKLQSLMTYGKEVPPDAEEFKLNYLNKLKAQEEEDDSSALFDHLIQEIKERLEFLQEMERLGQKKAYEVLIEQEIAAKMRQMTKIDKEKFLQLGINLNEIGTKGQTNNKNVAKQTFLYENNIFPSQ